MGWEALSLIQGLLTKDANQRLKASECKVACLHRWHMHILLLVDGGFQRVSVSMPPLCDQAHPFFQAHTPPIHTSEDWQRLFNKEYTPPFVPPDEDQEDAGHESGEKKKQQGCSVM